MSAHPQQTRVDDGPKRGLPAVAKYVVPGAWAGTLAVAAVVLGTTVPNGTERALSVTFVVGLAVLGVLVFFYTRIESHKKIEEHVVRLKRSLNAQH